MFRDIKKYGCETNAGAISLYESMIKNNYAGNESKYSFDKFCRVRAPFAELIDGSYADVFGTTNVATGYNQEDGWMELIEYDSTLRTQYQNYFNKISASELRGLQAISQLIKNRIYVEF